MLRKLITASIAFTVSCSQDTVKEQNGFEIMDQTPHPIYRNPSREIQASCEDSFEDNSIIFSDENVNIDFKVNYLEKSFIYSKCIKNQLSDYIFRHNYIQESMGSREEQPDNTVVYHSLNIELSKSIFTNVKDPSDIISSEHLKDLSKYSNVIIGLELPIKNDFINAVECSFIDKGSIDIGTYFIDDLLISCSDPGYFSISFKNDDVGKNYVKELLNKNLNNEQISFSIYLIITRNSVPKVYTNFSSYQLSFSEGFIVKPSEELILDRSGELFTYKHRQLFIHAFVQAP